VLPAVFWSLENGLHVVQAVFQDVEHGLHALHGVFRAPEIGLHARLPKCVAIPAGCRHGRWKMAVHIPMPCFALGHQQCHLFTYNTLAEGPIFQTNSKNCCQPFSSVLGKPVRAATGRLRQ
jgi:hypothetical protein